MLEAITGWLASEGVKWVSLKAGLQPTLSVSHDALHVILGVLIQIAVAAVTRSSLGRLLPWLIVLGLEVINEMNDIRVDVWPEFAMQLGESAKDALLTMFLPTVLLVLVRKQARVLRMNTDQGDRQ